MRGNRIKTEILAVLRELGGEVTDPNGRATRIISERIASTGTYTTVSTALGEMEQEGLVVRDQPNLKRVTRIAIAGDGIRPARKSIEVVAERVSRTLAQELEAQLRGILDAHVAAAQDGVTELEEANLELRRRLGIAIEQRDRARDEARAGREVAEDAQNELIELRERLRIAEHNVDVWKKRALGRPRIREMLTEVRDLLPEDTRRELERVMTELPRGGG